MKAILLFFFIILSAISFAQKSEFFKGVDFDSSYCIVGIVQGNNLQFDSLPQYWFVLDNLADMIRLKREWVFKKEMPRVNIEIPAIEIYTLRNKMEIIPVSLIFPKQGIIKSGNSWYKIDMKEIEKLHNNHPLHYHTQKFRYETFKQYVSFGNRLLNDSNLLFLLEASLRFEGKFYIYTKPTNDPHHPTPDLSDANQILKTIAGENMYESGEVDNDSFNIAHRDTTRYTVWGPKSLYDKFESRDFTKGNWIPAYFGMKVFWRD